LETGVIVFVGNFKNLMLLKHDLDKVLIVINSGKAYEVSHPNVLNNIKKCHEQKGK